MTLKDYLKLAWKASMRPLLRLYTRNHSMYIYNNRRRLNDDDIRRLYGESADNASSGKSSYSEYGQDAFVLRTLYRSKNVGTFVDIGANHPTKYSNSYLFELNGWTGVAVEPQQSLNELWSGLRKTPCLDCVVGAKDEEEVVFVEGGEHEHGFSGVDGYNKVHSDFTRRKIRQRTLDGILRDYNITNIDYLSIDVEGYEMKVLEGIDFSRVNIRLIGLENDIGFRSLPIIGRRLGFELGDNAIRRFLQAKGYKHIARIVSDDFFLKAEGAEAGSPGSGVALEHQHV